MNGHCLCGAVRITAPDAKEIGACHCGICRRWGGAALLALHCGTDVQFEGTEHVKVYASSSWAQRGFCQQCGTHLYYKLLPTGEYFVPAGVFESQDFAMTMQLFVDDKPGYYDFSNKTAMLTEQQVMEQFGPPAAGS